MNTVYVETSVFGYLASRTSSNLVVAGNQRLTLEWWAGHQNDFELFVSQAVVEECSAGDPQAASERIGFLDSIPILGIDDAARELSKRILADVPLPPRADVDALHIAIAAVNSMNYLLIWNCKHIANPSLRRKIDEVLVLSNVTPPIICTPQELINV